jgi:chromosome partitioning protein
MIVMIGGIKGGTGKTTIATNLAVLRSASGKKVLLVDADEQKSTSIWANQRDVLEIETKWTTVPLGGKALRSQLERMKRDYDDVIIDVGGRETTSLRAAISIADICVIPFKPRSLDIWTLGDIKALISEMRPANPNLKVFAMINQADSKGSDNEETINILQECEEIKCISTTIGSRKAFANAASDGLGVIEMKIIDKKAVQEIQDLYNFIYNKCISNV